MNQKNYKPFDIVKTKKRQSTLIFEAEESEGIDVQPEERDPAEIAEVLKAFSHIANLSKIWLYRCTLFGKDMFPYRAIVACDSEVILAEEERNPEPKEFPEGSLTIWGNEKGSSIEIPNIEYIAKMTCSVLGCFLTMQGVDVYINNSAFRPEDGVE